MRESGGRPDAFNPNRATGDESYGLFQVNMLGDLGPARRKQFGLRSNQDLLDAATNASVAYRMSKGGKDFGAWGLGPNAYRTGAGFDTIKKYYDSFPGAGKTGPSVPPVVGSAPSDRRSQYAQAIREGRWSVGSSLSKTISLSREFNRAFGGKEIPDSGGLKYPKVRGKVPVDAAPIVAEAYKWLGTPYSWAGGGTAGPSKGVGRGANTVGFDCSGFLQYLWGKRGVQIPRVTYDQWRTGQAVGRNELQPGDAVFFHPGPNGPEHVGMYVGDGKFIQAPRTGDVIKISSLGERSDFMGARRYS